MEQEKEPNELRACRKAAGLSQRQLSEKSNVPQPSIARIEAGRRSLGVKIAQKIAPVLNVDLLQLMGIENLSKNTTNHLTSDNQRVIIVCE